MKDTGKSSKPIIAAHATNQQGKEPAQPANGRSGRTRVSRVPKRNTAKMKSLVLERISDGILGFDAQMNHVYVDERAGELLGRSAGELLGKNFWQVYPNSKGTPFGNACQRAFETQTVIPFDGYFAPSNSWFEGRVYPSDDGLSVLISEHHHPDQDEILHILERSEEKFSKAFHSSPSAIAIIRAADRRILDANQSWLNLFGFERSQAVGRTTEEIGIQVFSFRREALRQAWQQQGRIQGQELEIQLHSGELCNLLLSMEEIEIEGEPSYLASVLDITERKRAEDKIRESSEFPLQNPNPVMRFTRDGRLLFANPASASLLDFWNQETGQALPAELRELLASIEPGSTKEIELRDHERRFTCLIVPIQDKDYVNLYFSDITERKKAERALYESRQRMTFALEKSHTGTWDLDLVNHTAYRSIEHDRIFGYESLLPRWTYEMFLDHVLPDDREEVNRRFQEATTTNTDWSFECRIRRVDGQVRWIWAIGGHQYDEAGNAYRMAGIVQDITERKQAEEQLRELTQRLTYHVDNSPLAVIEWGPDMRLIRWSGAAEQIFGWKAEEVLGKKIEDLHWVYEEDAQQVRDVSSDLRTGMDPKRFSANRNYRKDGSVVYCEWYNSSLLNEDGTLRSILSLVLDITERKQAEDALHNSEERFAKAFHASPEAITISQLSDGVVLEVNKNWKNLFGYEESEIYGRSSLDLNLFVDPDDRAKAIERLMMQGSLRDYEIDIRRKSGEIRHASLSVEKIEIKGVACLLTIIADVTERKQMEQRAHDHQKRQSFLLKLMDVIRSANKVTDLQRNACRLLGEYMHADRVHYGEFHEEEGFAIVGPDYHGDGFASLEGRYSMADFGETSSILRSGATLVVNDIDASTILSDRAKATYRALKTSALVSVPLVREGRLLWTLTVVSNEPRAWTPDELSLIEDFAERTWAAIERARYQHDLRESQQRLALTYHHAPIGIIEVSMDGRFVEANERFCRMLGYTREELLALTIMEVTHEDDRGSELELFERLQKNEIPFYQFEKRYLRKDGNLIWGEMIRALVRDSNGKPMYAIGAVLDITERKQREEALRARTEEVETLMEVSPIAIFVAHDPECRNITANPAGYQLVEMPGDSFVNISKSEPGNEHASYYVFRDGVELDAENLPLQLAARLGMEIEEETLELRFEKSTSKYIYAFAKPLFDDHGKVRGAIGSMLDITERKRVEDILRARTEEIETLMKVSPFGILVAHDADCTLITGNPAAYELLGLPSDSQENLSKSAVDPVAASSHRVFRDGVEFAVEELPMQRSARLGIEVEEQTLELRFEDGSRKYNYLYSKPLFDSQGKPRGAIAAVLDITERRKIEENLRLDATIMENVPAGIYLVRASDETVIYSNPTFNSLFGYEPGEIEGKHVSVINAPSERSPEDKEKEIIENLREKGSWQGEIYSLRKDGTPFWCFASVTTFEHASHGMVWVAARQDITERKRTEAALQQLNLELESRVERRTAQLQAAYEYLRVSEATSRLILESMPDAIIVTDKNGNIVYGNSQVEALFGYMPSELMGQSVETLIPERFHGTHKGHRMRFGKRPERRSMGLGIDLYGQRKDSSEFPVDVMLSPISNSTTWDVMITIRDNTQQKQAQEAIRTNEEKLRKLFEILPVGISFLDNQGKIMEMNSTLTQILGLTKNELLEGRFKTRRYLRSDGTPMPPTEFASARAHSEQKPVYDVETGIVKENGDIIWTSVNAAPVDVGDVDIVVATIDITERKKAEETLRKHRERLRVLSRRLVEVQEDERRAIADELHDRVGQNLAALNLNLNILRSQISVESMQAIGTRLDDSVSLVNQILNITRNVMADLRSNVLDDYGLESALREYADRFTQRTGIQVFLNKFGNPIPRFDPTIEMTLLRIAQESLTNVSRHAQADVVHIALNADGQAIYMSIEDNGIGILSWQKANQPGSHGLRIIRERAEAFGGSLQVHSAYKKGTRIEVRIPTGSTGPLKSREKRS